MTRAELLKVAKPILFSTEMVKAIQDGRKTVTRRVIKDQPYNCFEESAGEFVLCDKRAFYTDENSYKNIQTIKSKYQVGDILYVRETWQIDEQMPYDNYFYRADYEMSNGWCSTAWRPSIHMPKEAARMDKGKMICKRKHCERLNGSMCIRRPCPYGECLEIKSTYVDQINKACEEVGIDDRKEAGAVSGVKDGNRTA